MKKLFLSLLITVGIISAGTPGAVENFSLNDYNGKTISLTDFKD